jgi:hypothetical protein
MRSVNRFRQRTAWVVARAALLVFMATLLAPVSLAATPSQWGVSWDYKLLGKLNSAKDPETGLTILITGSGSFDQSQDTIGGGGSYTIFDTEGSVVGSGTWTATTFGSFIPAAPGNSPGEGGRLELEAQFSGAGSGALNDIQDVVIQCSMWGDPVGPPGYPWRADFVEVGSYTIPETGAVMFNLNQ